MYDFSSIITPRHMIPWRELRVNFTIEFWHCYIPLVLKIVLLTVLLGVFKKSYGIHKFNNFHKRSLWWRTNQKQLLVWYKFKVEQERDFNRLDVIVMGSIKITNNIVKLTIHLKTTKFFFTFSPMIFSSYSCEKVLTLKKKNYFQ